MRTLTNAVASNPVQNALKVTRQYKGFIAQCQDFHGARACEIQAALRH